MPRFFIDASPQGKAIILNGADAHHIAHVLRMQVGDALTICDAAGAQYSCTLTELHVDSVTAGILSVQQAAAESSLAVTLLMALPKSDKMDFIVQKTTELGVTEIVPYAAARCVSRPDARTLMKKCARWRKIAEEAAKQSGRGRVPTVQDVMTFPQAVAYARQAKTALLLYEGERQHGLRAALTAEPLSSVSVMIGPEGGFEEREVTSAVQADLTCVSLGPRILRCETAPIVALTALQYQSGNLE